MKEAKRRGNTWFFFQHEAESGSRQRQAKKERYSNDCGYRSVRKNEGRTKKKKKRKMGKEDKPTPPHLPRKKNKRKKEASSVGNFIINRELSIL